MTHIERLQVTAELLAVLGHRLDAMAALREQPIYTADGQDYLDLLAGYLEVGRYNAAQCEVVPANFLELIEEAQGHCAKAAAGPLRVKVRAARLILAGESAHRAAVVAERTVAEAKAGRAA